MRHAQRAVLARAHCPGDALLWLLDAPLADFDLAASLPYVLDLRERWRETCLAEMAGELPRFGGDGAAEYGARACAAGGLAKVG